MSIQKIVNVSSVPQRSPFRYPGGKTWLIPHIRRWLGSLEFSPDLFVEPFAGGGIVGLTVGFEGLAKHVVLVELDVNVAAVWQTITSNEYKKLCDKIVDFEVTRENVQNVLADSSVTRLEMAFRTIIRNRMQHGGIMAPGASLIKHGENGKGLSSRWYPDTLAKRIEAIGEKRDRFTVVHGDGIQEIDRYKRRKKAVFFIDPPYTVSGKKAGKRLYAHNEIDHELLFMKSCRVKGDFLMTYDFNDAVCSLASKHGLQTEMVAMKNTHHAEMSELLIGKDLGWVKRRDMVQLSLKFPD